MNDRPTDLSSRPPFQAPRRSLFSARKFALMASVVAGLGIAVYGFGPSQGPADIFSSPAHAQVNNEVSKVEKPVGFADIVERVKPSTSRLRVSACCDRSTAESRASPAIRPVSEEVEVIWTI